MYTEPQSLASLHLRRIQVAEYHKMIEAAVFDEDEPIELLEGVIVTMSPQGVSHARVIQRLNRILTRSIGENYIVRPQLPLTIGADSEPEPDLAVVTVDAAEAGNAHPSSAALVVEVSSKSLDRDRNIKYRLYARTEIPEYWLVNLPDNQLEVYRHPDANQERYKHHTTLDCAATVTPMEFPDLHIPVGEILSV